MIIFDELSIKFMESEGFKNFVERAITLSVPKFLPPS